MSLLLVAKGTDMRGSQGATMVAVIELGADGDITWISAKPTDLRRQFRINPRLFLWLVLKPTTYVASLEKLTYLSPMF